VIDAFDLSQAQLRGWLRGGILLVMALAPGLEARVPRAVRSIGGVVGGRHAFASYLAPGQPGNRGGAGMTRSAVVWIALFALVGAMGIVAPARAGIFVEPEIGGRWMSASWSDFGSESSSIRLDGNILGPGITAGGTIGFNVAPMFAVVAHADLGFHGAPDDLTIRYLGQSRSLEFVDSGMSLALLLGGRIYPLGADEKALVQPYAGLGFGLGSIAWSYTAEGEYNMDTDTDGVGALLIALEAGGDMKVSKFLSVGAGGRYIFNQWSKESVEELDTSDLTGNSFSLQTHVGFHF
jgi:hypothetical protein